MVDQIPFIWEDIAQPLSLRANGMHNNTKAIPEVRPAAVLLCAKASSGGQPGMALAICSTALAAGCSAENQHFVEEIIGR